MDLEIACTRVEFGIGTSKARSRPLAGLTAGNAHPTVGQVSNGVLDHHQSPGRQLEKK